MEYEIRQEGEDALFDDSTNPSLKYDDNEDAVFFRRLDKSKLQKGELIPEEDQLS